MLNFRSILICCGLAVSGLTLTGCSEQTMNEHKALLGQKLMLDLRYFCNDDTPSMQCKTPVTELTPQLADVLVQGQIGGVILFAENLETIPQIVTLIYDMQQVMKDNNLPPLFIAIDQEGGRVARLSDDIATRFVGNMAIGATYDSKGTYFASEVGKGIARSIRELGFNLNFAPTVDVNVNPDNPVINVRSYGEHPQQVAELGQATVAAMQAEGVMSALKHFPGHGDTHVDSHTGLPRVEHDKATIDSIDLLPFKHIIDSSAPPAMIMTAHIQYPQLDSSTFVAKSGEATILPATMSEAILTGLLRNKLNYHGVIVTDALDMAGIAHYFDQTQAVIQTFKAGADIALMPYTIRNPADIKGVKAMYQAVLKAMDDGTLSLTEMQASAARIAELKAQYRVDEFASQPLKARVDHAMNNLPMAQNKAIEAALAQASITQLFNHNALPLSGDKTWQVVMPDTSRCQAFEFALKQHAPDTQANCLSLATLPEGQPWLAWQPGDVVVIGDITPPHSLAEMGGMDDMSRLSERADKPSQYAFMREAMTYAKSQGMPVVLVALRAPYVVSQFEDVSDAALTTYGYNVEVDSHDQAQGVVFDALVDVLLGHTLAPGHLPVTVK